MRCSANRFVHHAITVFSSKTPGTRTLHLQSVTQGRDESNGFRVGTTALLRFDLETCSPRHGDKKDMAASVMATIWDNSPGEWEKRPPKPKAKPNQTQAGPHQLVDLKRVQVAAPTGGLVWVYLGLSTTPDVPLTDTFSPLIQDEEKKHLQSSYISLPLPQEPDSSKIPPPAVTSQHG